MSTYTIGLNSEGVCTVFTYVLFHKYNNNKTHLRKYAVSGILLLHYLTASSDKGQGDKFVLSEGIHSEKLQSSL